MKIEIADLSKLYGDRRALDHLTLTVAEGELFCLLGPNGSGKSTLFRILSTLARPTSGRVIMGGMDVVQSQADVRARIGVVFQNPSLDGKLTVAENLRFAGAMYGLSGPTLKDRIAKVTDSLRLGDRGRDRVETLSGGLQRRVELAKALLTDAALLLLDEPSTGLDPAARVDFWTAIESLRRDRPITVIFTSHLMDETEKACRVAVLDEGKLVALNTPAALLAEAGPHVVRAEVDDPAAATQTLGAAIDKLAIHALDKELRVRTDRPGEVAALIQSLLGDALRSLTISRPSMDDVFLMKTGHRLNAP